MPTVTIDARDGFAPDPRGWGRYARELVQALRAGAGGAGITLDVIERGGRGPEVLWEQVVLPLRLFRTRPAVVHATNCFLPLRRPCPGVVTIHDLAFEVYPEDFAPRTRAKYRSLTPRAARSAERVIVPSEYTRDDLVDRYGIPPEKVRVIPEAPALPRGTATPPEGTYVLAVGDLRAKKNLGSLVRAWLALRAEGLDHRLVLAGGDAGEGARLRALAGDAPLEITGYVDDARLDALMRGAEVLVHPSLYEGFGLVVVEAMARGCPVIAASSTSLPEAGGDAALYVDELEPLQIAAAIRLVIDDPVRREGMIAAGRARAAELSWERAAGATASVYRELL